MRILISLIALLVPVSGWAATYYVDKRVGNDTYSAAQAQNPATPWKTFTKALNVSHVPSGAHTIEVAAGSGPYVTTDFDIYSGGTRFGLGYIYATQNVSSVITINGNGNAFEFDVDVNTDSYSWTKSNASGKTDWYYLTNTNGTAPTSIRWNSGATTFNAQTFPAIKSCVVNGVWSAASTNLTSGFPLIGRFAENNWAYGNFDSLGFNTLYVRYDNGTNPTGGGRIMVPVLTVNLQTNSGYTAVVVNDAIISGANTRNVSAGAPVTLNRCVLRNADQEGIQTAAAGGHVVAINTIFHQCGHRGIVTNYGAANVTARNCHFEDVHLALKINHSSASTIIYQNNSSKNLLAGGIQWDTTITGPTLTEGNNQWHIDPDTQHGGPSISFTGGTRQWVTTAASDIPPSTATTSFPGVDPQATIGIPLPTSPLIGAGTPISGLTTDFLGKNWKNPPSIGAYEYYRKGGSGWGQYNFGFGW